MLSCFECDYLSIRLAEEEAEGVSYNKAIFL